MLIKVTYALSALHVGAVFEHLLIDNNALADRITPLGKLRSHDPYDQTESSPSLSLPRTQHLRHFRLTRALARPRLGATDRQPTPPAAAHSENSTCGETPLAAAGPLH